MLFPPFGAPENNENFHRYTVGTFYVSDIPFCLFELSIIKFVPKVNTTRSQQ